MHAREAEKLTQNARTVLRRNDKGQWTIPAEGVYPHQWLWDSCFIAMGYATYDPQRGATELLSLLRGQWSNGMLPHMVFTPQPHRPDDARLWRSWREPEAPKNVFTSGITQPPVLAEAVQRVAKKLPTSERQEFLQQMVPAILRHHEWLYRERDPDQRGLVIALHPWESGMDNSPSWTEELRYIHKPRWWHLFNVLRLHKAFNFVRADKSIPLSQRITVRDALAFFHAANAIVKRHYDTKEIINSGHFAVESLSFNSILVRNNTTLVQLAKDAAIEVPSWLLQRMKRAEEAIEELCWDEERQLYSHRAYNQMVCVSVPTASSFFPLYAGTISRKRAKQLVESLTDGDVFWTQYPVPSVPVNSPYFEEHRFWRGPTWINSNWLIIRGLQDYGFSAEAEVLREKTLELVQRSGFYEYFSPVTGQGLGAANFSWTAALVLDLLAES